MPGVRSPEAQVRHNARRETLRLAQMGGREALRTFYRNKKRLERARKLEKPECLVWGNEMSREERLARKALGSRLNRKGQKIASVEPFKPLRGSRTAVYFADDFGTIHASWCPCYDCHYGSLVGQQRILRGIAPMVEDEEAGSGNGCRRSRDPARRVGRLPRYAVM